nr:S26 family signal peptidase [Methanothermococcus sp.]
MIEWIVFLIVLLTVWTHVNVVVSNSMYPVMERGDFVIVENANWEFNPNDVQVGDIVVYKAHWPKYWENHAQYIVKIDNKTLIRFDGNHIEPVIHRIIKKIKINNTTYIITKGDNNPTYDPELISTNQIKQRVVDINGKPLVIPYIGYISIFLKENIWLVILIVIIWYVYDYYVRKNKEKDI